MITAGECGVFSPKIMEAFRQSRVKFEKVIDELGHVGSLSEDEE
jgi:putative two-component system response regulator